MEKNEKKNATKIASNTRIYGAVPVMREGDFEPVIYISVFYIILYNVLYVLSFYSRSITFHVFSSPVCMVLAFLHAHVHMRSHRMKNSHDGIYI